MKYFSFTLPRETGVSLIIVYNRLNTSRACTRPTHSPNAPSGERRESKEEDRGSTQPGGAASDQVCHNRVVGMGGRSGWKSRPREGKSHLRQSTQAKRCGNRPRDLQAVQVRGGMKRCVNIEVDW